MGIWRYIAFPENGGQRQSGVLSGESAPEVRASIRRLGLTPVEVRRVWWRQARPQSNSSQDGAQISRESTWFTSIWSTSTWFKSIAASLGESWVAYQRGRRIDAKADLFDSLATLSEAGVPILEALAALDDSKAASGHSGTTHARTLLVAAIRDRLRSGASLAEAMGEHPGWFDPAEVAMVRAGELSGELESVLHGLASRQRQRNELSSALAGALAYPALVTVVGVGVVIFLANKTLPELTATLVSAGVEIPPLTAAIMWIGQKAPVYGLPVLAAMLAGGMLLSIAVTRTHLVPAWVSQWAKACMLSLTPAVIRRAIVARAMSALAELSRTGVPLVEALRVIAPTLRGPVAAQLSGHMRRAADEVGRGRQLSETFQDSRWFDQQTRALLRVAESGGELHEILDRVARRDHRRFERALRRFTTLLEPLVIILLAILIGVVVMAAVLPLIRLQEIV